LLGGVGGIFSYSASTAGCNRGGVPLKIGRSERNTSTQLTAVQTWNSSVLSRRAATSPSLSLQPPHPHPHPQPRTVCSITTLPLVLLECRALSSTPVHRTRPSLPASSDLGVDRGSNCDLQGLETLHVDRDHGNLCATCWHEPYEICC
jgi:hypothetical protein